MNIDRIIDNSNKEIKFDIKYKTDSTLMKVIDTVMFFNPNFRTYITTINNTIYFPNKEYLTKNPLSSISVLLHELVHVHDKNKISFLLFSLLYLSPQIWVLLAIPVSLLVSVKVGVLLLLCLLPIPALGRAYLEYRAYCMSIYATYLLGQTFNISIDFAKMNESICKQFVGSSYYFMFPFKKFLLNRFNGVVEKCLKGEHPFEDKIFVMADKILEKE